MADYESMTVHRLKKELSSRNAVVTGRKKDLIERLQAYDRNANFQGPIVTLPEEVVAGWPTTGFKSLTETHISFLPKVSDGQIHGYLMYRTAVDKNSTDDIKSLEKGRHLYEAGRVEACSVHITKDYVNFTGIVQAAMKKKVSYNYKLRLSGRNGEVINSDCECPAGKGPHATCKHVAAVLLLLRHFTNTGKLSVAKSATEILQTFHKPKNSYSGSPIKAEDLPSKIRPTLDDPRPAQYRNNEGYNTHVRNLVLNYCSNTSKDLAMRFRYEKADIQTATLDHDYLQLPFTEYWVDHSQQVNEREANETEETTRTQSQSKRWHEAREWRVTASRFGEICRATNRRNIFKLCQSLRQHKRLHGPAIVHGIQYESEAIKKFQNESGLQVKKCGLFVDVERPYLGATPDGVVNDGAIIEVKCPYSGRNDDFIKPGPNFPFLAYNEDGDIKLKTYHKYYYQVQGQLYLSKRSFCYFVVFIFNDLYIEKIPVDLDYCKFALLPKLDLFYVKYYRKHLASNL